MGGQVSVMGHMLVTMSGRGCSQGEISFYNGVGVRIIN